MNTQCEKFRENFEDYLLGKISSLEKKNLEAHLTSCGDCRRELEGEKKILVLFQSMERKPAPEILRQRALDFAQRQKEAGAGWKVRLHAILTLQRLKVLTGAAALALLLFWCVQIIRAPRPLEKSPMKVSQDTHSLGLRTEAPMERSTDLKSKAIVPEITDRNEDISQASPAPASPAPEISKKGVFKEGPDEGVMPVQSKSSPSITDEKLVQERRVDEKNNWDMDTTALNLKKKIGKDGYLDITERLKAFSAVQISQLEKDKDSSPDRYAFAISYSEFERFKKETENTNIRIVSVKPLTVSDSLLKAKREVTSQIQQTQKVDSFYSQQPEPKSAARAAQPAEEGIARKSTSQKPVMKGKKEMEPEYQYILKDAPTLTSAAASQTPAGSISINGAQPQAPQKGREQAAFFDQPPVQTVDNIQRDNLEYKAGDSAKLASPVSGESGQIMDDFTSPTTIEAQEQMLRNRLTSDESLVYVEIQVEPDK
jgi:hypothetical protein